MSAFFIHSFFRNFRSTKHVFRFKRFALYALQWSVIISKRLSNGKNRTLELLSQPINPHNDGIPHKRSSTHTYKAGELCFLAPSYQFSTYFHGLRLRHRRDSPLIREKCVSSLILLLFQTLVAFVGLHIDIEN